MLTTFISTFLTLELWWLSFKLSALSIGGLLCCQAYPFTRDFMRRNNEYSIIYVCEAPLRHLPLLANDFRFEKHILDYLVMKRTLPSFFSFTLLYFFKPAFILLLISLSIVLLMCKIKELMVYIPKFWLNWLGGLWIWAKNESE